MKVNSYKINRAIGIFFLLCLVSCTTGRQGVFHAFVGSPSLENAHIGVLVKSLNENSERYQVNATRFFLPASNMKLFTTAAALVLLGPEFRFTTGVYTDGTLNEGVLRGTLFIKGVGDPTLSWRFHDGGARRIFAEWAEALEKLGVTHITGNIVGDGSLFDEQYMGSGWAWDDEIHCYSAQISALSFDDNCVSVRLLPGADVGERANVTVDDPSGGLIVRNQAFTAQPEDDISIKFSRLPGQNVVRIAGGIPLAAHEERFFLSIHNPALLAAETFKRALEQKGITVGGSAIDHKLPAEALSYDLMKALTSYTSPPLGAVLRQVNKRSQNLYAELLFRTLGVTFGTDGSPQAAAAILKDTLVRMGVAPDSVVIHDGSGLSRLNLVTPSAIVSLLEYMYRHENFSYFLDSLAVAGVDGTLRHRMTKTAAEGRVIAKTGTMTHILNLSGYVKGREGRMLAFSLMTNNYTRSMDELKALQDALCVGLVDLVE